MKVLVKFGMYKYVAVAVLKLNAYFRYQGQREEPQNGLSTEGAKDEQTEIVKEKDLERVHRDKKDKDELDEKSAKGNSGKSYVL